MHLSIAILSTIATLSSAAVTSHDVPACASACLTGVWETSSCSEPDLPCLCHDPVGLTDRMAPCAMQSCSDDASFGVAMKFAYSLCHNPAEKHDVLRKRTFDNWWPEKHLPLVGSDVEDACNKCAAGNKMNSPVSGQPPSEEIPDSTTTTTTVSGYGDVSGNDYSTPTTNTPPEPTQESDLSGNQPGEPADLSGQEPAAPPAPSGEEPPAPGGEEPAAPPAPATPAGEQPTEPAAPAYGEPTGPVELSGGEAVPPVELSGDEPSDLSGDLLSNVELSGSEENSPIASTPDSQVPRLPKSDSSDATKTSMAFALGLLGLMITMA